MEFDLHRSLQEVHKSDEALQRQILKVSAFGKTNNSLGIARRASWRTQSAGPKVKSKGQKGSLRFLTLKASAARTRTPSWRLKKIVPPTFEEVTADASSAEFQVTEASNLAEAYRHDLPYLAVSYCWPRGKDKERLQDPGEFYWVRDARAPGRVRRTKAPKAIIDRAVAFAKDRGIRLLWLDSECINQEDRFDKECGIRSMDGIFYRAKKVVGLLQKASITHPVEADALRRLSHHEYLDFDLYNAAVDTVKRISEDPWFTRAWTLQEATSGGNTLELSMKCNPALKRRDTEEWGNVMDEIQFDWAHIHKWIAGLYAQAAIYDQHPPLSSTRDQLDALVSTVDGIRMSLMNHFPLLHEPVKMSRPRLCCNASTALMFLKDRKNSRAPDRVSIMANLGDYPIKLDTAKIAPFNMGACILAQALVNGDLSLLSGIEKGDWARKSNSGGFSWLPPLATYLEDIEPLQEGYPPLRLSDHSISAKGLSLPGYRWKINERFDVSHIRDKYAEQWKELDVPDAPKVLSLLRRTQRHEEESFESFHYRVLDEAEKYTGRDFEPFVNSHHFTKRHKLGSEILWALLCHLASVEHLDLANSIWHSVRTRSPSMTPGEKEKGISEELPTSLEEYTLFDKHGKTLQVPFFDDISQISRLFRPIEDNWEWLVERIISHGELWGGHAAYPHSAAIDCDISCIFDVSAQYEVLTPDCRGMEAMEDYGRLRSQSLPPMRSKRISWIIQALPAKRQNQRRRAQEGDRQRTLIKRMSTLLKMNPDAPSLHPHTTKGMVAGMWKLKDLKPARFTLI
ncbi:MAG: hypothetical protein Q9227_005842 [Pyrenula ochraceoflavens]